MKDIQLLIKKDNLLGKYTNIYPKTYTDAIIDKESGKSLHDILLSFNMYFLNYTGNTATTRLKVPAIVRKRGLWITYVKYDNNIYTEWYAGELTDDTSWQNSSNWRIGNNTLVGDITISANGNWVINGTETEFKAVGEKGNTPLVRFDSNNKFQVSYNNGDKWLDISNSITNNLRIKKYIGTNESLPTSGVEEGAIYMKGPYYAEDDTSNNNPIYRMWIYSWKGNTLAWQDNGEFTSIAAGVVQEIGNSATEVMSQDAVTKKFASTDAKLTELEYSISNVEETINSEVELRLTEVEKVVNLINTLSLGKFYGFYNDSTLLPLADVNGYAYVGNNNLYRIYNYIDGHWSDSGLLVSKSDIFVTPQMYGAVADGITDDSSAIQSAINSGFNVYINNINTRTYLVGNTILIPSNRKIDIENGVILKSKNGLNAPIFQNIETSVGNSNIIINGGIFDGNKDNQTVRHAIIHFEKVSNFTISNAKIHDVHCYVSVNWGAIRIKDSNHGLIKNLEVYDCDHEGMIIETSQYILVSGGHYHNNGNSGIDAPESSDIRIESVVSTDNFSSGISLNGKRMSVIGCYVKGNKWGINIGHKDDAKWFADRAICIGNISTANEYGIQIQQGTKDVVLDNNNSFNNIEKNYVIKGTVSNKYVNGYIALGDFEPKVKIQGYEMNGTMPNDTFAALLGGSNIRWSNGSANMSYGNFIKHDYVKSTLLIGCRNADDDMISAEFGQDLIETYPTIYGHGDIKTLGKLSFGNFDAQAKIQNYNMKSDVPSDTFMALLGGSAIRWSNGAAVMTVGPYITSDYTDNTLVIGKRSGGTDFELLRLDTKNVKCSTPFSAITIQIGDKNTEANASTVGTLRYINTNSYSSVVCCMQTGENLYEWVEIIRKSW